MLTFTASLRTASVLTLALVSVALAGCTTAAPSTTAEPGSATSDMSADDFELLLGMERAGVAVLAQQWTGNDCSVSLAFSPDDLVCADILAGADLTSSYEDLAGGLGSLSGDAAKADAVRTAFADSVSAGDAWNAAGCADNPADSCADEAEVLISTLLTLDAAFEDWES